MKGYFVPRSLERSIFNSLKKLFWGMINDIRNGFVKKDQVQEAARKFINSEEVDAYLNNLMARMTNRIRIDSAKAMKRSTAGTNSALLFNLLKHEMDGPIGRRVYEIVAENAAYIKTVPQEWATFVTLYTQRESLKGKRPEMIEAELRKILPEHATKNLKTIARTECAKANAAITEARAEALGCKCYIWRSVKDERTRSAHAMMDGILVFYDDPPSPEELFGGRAYGNYHAGNTFNCRCYQNVVVDQRFLPDTFKYYRAGAVHATTKAKFLKKFGKIA